MHPGDERGGGVPIEIDKITIHPKYHPFTFENDIAVIKFQEVIFEVPTPNLNLVNATRS